MRGPTVYLICTNIIKKEIKRANIQNYQTPFEKYLYTFDSLGLKKGYMQFNITIRSQTKLQDTASISKLLKPNNSTNRVIYFMNDAASSH